VSQGRAESVAHQYQEAKEIRKVSGNEHTLTVERGETPKEKTRASGATLKGEDSSRSQRNYFINSDDFPLKFVTKNICFL